MLVPNQIYNLILIGCDQTDRPENQSRSRYMSSDSENQNESERVAVVEDVHGDPFDGSDSDGHDNSEASDVLNQLSTNASLNETPRTDIGLCLIMAPPQIADVGAAITAVHRSCITWDDDFCELNLSILPIKEIESLIDIAKVNKLQLQEVELFCQIHPEV